MNRSLCVHQVIYCGRMEVRLLVSDQLGMQMRFNEHHDYGLINDP